MADAQKTPNFLRYLADLVASEDATFVAHLEKRFAEAEAEMAKGGTAGAQGRVHILDVILDAALFHEHRLIQAGMIDSEDAVGAIINSMAYAVKALVVNYCARADGSDIAFFCALIRDQAKIHLTHCSQTAFAAGASA